MAHARRPHSSLNSLKQLVAGVSWLAAADGLGKLSRIVTVIALARWLSPEEIAVAALALAIFELTRSLTQVGLAASIVNASPADLPSTNASAHLLNWVIALIVSSALSTLPLALTSFSPATGQMLQWLAPTLLFYPIVAVRMMNAQRAQNMKAIGLVSALALVSDNLTTAGLLAQGMGPQSVVIGKWVAGAVWVTGAIASTSAAVHGQISRTRLASLLRFGAPVLATEFLRSARAQLDLLLAAAVLAETQLGYYAFARNAGIGLSMSAQALFHTALLPWAARRHRSPVASGQIRRQSRAATAVLSGVFVLQALAAPIYVPLLFGSSWQAHALIVSVLCLSALPRLWIDTQGVLLRAAGHPKQEAALMLKFAAVLLVALVLCVTIGQPAQADTFATVVTAAFYLAAAWSVLIRRNPQPLKTNHPTGV